MQIVLESDNIPYNYFFLNCRFGTKIISIDKLFSARKSDNFEMKFQQSACHQYSRPRRFCCPTCSDEFIFCFKCDQIKIIIL